MFKATEAPEACDTNINNYLRDIKVLFTIINPDVNEKCVNLLFIAYSHSEAGF